MEQNINKNRISAQAEICHIIGPSEPPVGERSLKFCTGRLRLRGSNPYTRQYTNLYRKWYLSHILRTKVKVNISGKKRRSSPSIAHPIVAWYWTDIELKNHVGHFWHQFWKRNKSNLKRGPAEKLKAKRLPVKVLPGLMTDESVRILKSRKIKTSKIKVVKRLLPQS